jgi:hypothetical protein
MHEPRPIPDPLVPLRDALRGRYDVQRELGRGGMGIVYLAHEVALDRPVALELLPPELAADPVWRERFVREAKTAAAAQRLLADVPENARQALRDLPHALLRLDLHGRGLETWIEELETDPAALDGARPELLERLRAGTGTLESVSARLAAAMEIGETVDGMLEGRGGAWRGREE